MLLTDVCQIPQMQAQGIPNHTFHELIQTASGRFGVHWKYIAHGLCLTLDVRKHHGIFNALEAKHPRLIPKRFLPSKARANAIMSGAGFITKNDLPSQFPWDRNGFCYHPNISILIVANVAHVTEAVLSWYVQRLSRNDSQDMKYITEEGTISWFCIVTQKKHVSEINPSFGLFNSFASGVTLSINTMTSSNGSIFRVTGSLRRESTGPWRIPLTKASDEELWCFLWSAPEQMVEQTVQTPVIRDAIVLIMSSL